MATHSSILAWEIPGTEEPGGLQSMGLQRVRHGLATEQQSDKVYPPKKSVCVYAHVYIFPLQHSHVRRKPSQLFCAAAAVKSLQSYLTLCNPIDGSPPGSPIPGILQARTLEWVAISFSNA